MSNSEVPGLGAIDVRNPIKSPVTDPRASFVKAADTDGSRFWMFFQAVMGLLATSLFSQEPATQEEESKQAAERGKAFDAMMLAILGPMATEPDTVRPDVRREAQNMRDYAVAPPSQRMNLSYKLEGSLGIIKAHLMDIAMRPESRGDYDIAFGGRHPKINGKLLSECTVAEVLHWQKTAQIPVAGGTNAVGKFQIIPSTMQGIIDGLKLTGNEKFDVAMQERMGVFLLKRRGLTRFLRGEISAETMARNMSKEWAGLSENDSNTSYYGGVGANPHKAGITFREVVTALNDTKHALISSGFTNTGGTSLPGGFTNTGGPSMLSGTFLMADTKPIATGVTHSAEAKTPPGSTSLQNGASPTPS
jgi:hypothetical protein